MKTLTLLRHAKSSWKDRALTDRERPLNHRGQKDAPMMGKRLVKADLRPSLIVSSPAVRAWTTARMVALELGYPLEFLQREDSLYLASLDTWLDVVAAQDNDFNNLLVCGHNPGLTDFANFLAPGLTHNVPTAGVVCVNIDRDDWLLYEQPGTELVFFDYPKNKGKPGPSRD